MYLAIILNKLYIPYLYEKAGGGGGGALKHGFGMHVC